MLLDRLRLRPLAAGRTTIADHWDNLFAHRDPYARLYVILDRVGDLELDGTPVQLRPGAAYLLPDGVPIRFGRARGMDHVWFHFRATLDAGVSLFAVRDLPVCVHQADGLLPVAHEALEIAAFLEDGHRPVPAASGDLPEPDQLRFRLATRLRLLLEPFLAGARTHPRADDVARLAPVFDHVETHLDQELRIPDLARLVNLHPTYFAERFTRAVGRSPSRYIQTRRLEAAQLLLLDSGRAIKAIARETGFHDVAYFCRVFRALTGTTPGAYRERGRV